MRKSVVKKITLYLLAGVFLNAIAMLAMLNEGVIKPDQMVLVLFLTDLCIVQILYIIATKQEQLECKKYGGKPPQRPHIVHASKVDDRRVASR